MPQQNLGAFFIYLSQMKWLNWKTLLALIAIFIVGATIYYSNYISKKLAVEERKKVELWVSATNNLLTTEDVAFELEIVKSNNDIPIILTDEKDSIIDSKNLDSFMLQTDKKYLNQKLKEFKAENEPVLWKNPIDTLQTNKYYYGKSELAKEVKYYPLIQLFIVALFIVITLMALRSNYRSTQNQVWAGLAKETAHQLGTPVSSLKGWVEVLRETNDKSITDEIEKDVSRLELISDRFSKIGSKPKLEEVNIVSQIQTMMDYMKKRAGANVQFSIKNNTEDNHISAFISPPLFDWVIENLLKNALDAMEGKGSINVSIEDKAAQIIIDVADSGKGISKQNIGKVFKPGFTTKKRGWGLGLTLTKRIAEQYHNGNIYVKQSEPGKGTTFRIVLNK